jgi:hypothetical protein
MSPHDIWNSIPIYENSFYFYYMESLFVNGMGEEEYDPHYESMVDREWVDPGENEESPENEEEINVQDLIDFIMLNLRGHTYDDPIDLTQ